MNGRRALTYDGELDGRVRKNKKISKYEDIYQDLPNAVLAGERITDFSTLPSGHD